jgi:hypothetical protein
MMHSLAAHFAIHFYDAASTLYHHMVIIDNRKMKEIKKAGRLFVNENTREKSSTYPLLFLSVSIKEKTC